MNYKIGFITLGCEKNRVDMEIMMSALKMAGFKLCEDVLNCDIAVINTCSFIDNAKTESIEEILKLAKQKEYGKLKFLIVTGCMAEKYKEEVMKEIPEIDAVVGIGSNKNIVEIIKNTIAGKKVEKFGSKLSLPLDGKRVQSTPNYFAYLKISEGCNNYCSYCSIPFIRGKYRSRSISSIINEAIILADNGVKELNIIAQDTTRYGEDNYNKLMLPKLLKKLCEIDKIKWIRLFYCYPDRITDTLLDVIASEEKIVKYLDIPLQHCSQRILKDMNRFGDYSELKSLIEKIRFKIPDISLRTTFIIGFPGETQSDFESLCDFVKEMKFERMGCFTYSRQEGTKAFNLANQVDESTKLKRQQILMNIQYDIMENNSIKLIGKTFTVLTEGFDNKNNMYYGRSYHDAYDIDNKTYYKCNKKLHLGEFVKVKIIQTNNCNLIAQVI